MLCLTELVLGVDDFAIKKRDHSHTGIHNLKSGTMLHLRPGRDELRAYTMIPKFLLVVPKAVVMDLTPVDQYMSFRVQSESLPCSCYCSAMRSFCCLTCRCNSPYSFFVPERNKNNGILNLRSYVSSFMKFFLIGLDSLSDSMLKPAFCRAIK